MSFDPPSAINLRELALRELKKHYVLRKETPPEMRVEEDSYVGWLNRIFTKISGHDVVMSVYDTRAAPVLPDGGNVIKNIYKNDLADMKKDKHRRTFGEGKDERYSWFITETN